MRDLGVVGFHQFTKLRKGKIALFHLEHNNGSRLTRARKATQVHKKIDCAHSPGIFIILLNDGYNRQMVIVGGLIVSQFITLFITPVIYLYLEEFQERVLDRVSFFRRGSSVVSPAP